MVPVSCLTVHFVLEGYICEGCNTGVFTVFLAVVVAFPRRDLHGGTNDSKGEAILRTGTYLPLESAVRSA